MSSPTKDVTASTTTSTAAATGCNLLKIKQVHKMIQKPHHDSKYGVESSKFQVAGHTWSFIFYPNVKNNSGSDYSSVCLKLHAAAAAAIPGRRRHDAALRPCAPQHEMRSYATSFSGVGNVEYRCFRFTSHDDLEEQCYIDDDLAIHCDVAVVDEAAAELRPADLGSLMTCKCRDEDDLCKSGTQRLKEAFCKPFLGCFGLK